MESIIKDTSKFLNFGPAVDNDNISLRSQATMPAAIDQGQNTFILGL